MIKRLWHGKIKAEDGEAYHRYMVDTGIKEYKRTPGNRFADMVLQREGDSMRVWAVSLWDDYESIKIFAGEEIQKAKYYDEDQKFLLELEPEVYHVETTDDEVILQLFVAQFARLYHNQAWFGENFLAKFKDLDDRVVFTRPHPYVHSIAEILSHCIYWREPLIKRLEGDLEFKASMKSPENWPENDTLRKEGFMNLKSKFESTQVRIVDRLLRSSSAILHKEYRPGYSFEVLIEGVIEHDIYHLGQIGLVKMMVRGNQ